MLGFEHDGVIFIVLTVVLFMLLGIAILVIVDHKADMPGQFQSDLFSIRGIRRDHPVIAFLTTIILGSIIVILIFELTVTLGTHFGLFVEKEPPRLLQELKKQRVSERNRHFHIEPVVDLINMGEKSVCFSCHGDYPHFKEVMIRTLMNMHTQFIGCMTCHNDPEKIEEESLSFAWLNFSGIEVKGKPFGVDNDPITGYLQETDDYYSKIVAYSKTTNGTQLLEILESDSLVQEYLEIKDQLSDTDRDAIKKLYHKIVSTRGRSCAKCHTDENDSYLPYRKLGFSEGRIGDITNQNIIGIVQNYKKFYLPNLFEKGVLQPRKASVGTDSDGQASKSSEDPKDWWQRTFDAPSKTK